MSFEDFNFIRLSQDHIIKPFDCKDEDLNDFLFNDAKDYQRQLLAVTYILESDTETVAFFSLLNDKISFEHEIKGNTKFWSRFNRNIPNSKRSKHGYPAMKIGRLAVNSNFQGQGIGNLILNYLKEWFVNNNRTGCKFITLDGYKGSLKFYENNGFKYLVDSDELEQTRLMYFNLSTILNEQDQ